MAEFILGSFLRLVLLYCTPLCFHKHCASLVIYHPTLSKIVPMCILIISTAVSFIEKVIHPLQTVSDSLHLLTITSTSSTLLLTLFCSYCKSLVPLAFKFADSWVSVLGYLSHFLLFPIFLVGNFAFLKATG